MSVNIKELIAAQRSYYNNGNTKNIAFRKDQLKKLRQAIFDNEENILEALKKDMGRAPLEAYLSEITLVLKEISFALKNIDKWSAAIKAKTPLIHLLSSSYIYPEPYGVVLIIGPWNYPFQLVMAPLVGAVAAGNCAIIKTPGAATETSKVIASLIKENFHDCYISVVESGKNVNENLLRENFDYIFFTGSSKIGKNVMKAAAENLTPVTLELGGKSPCIVHKDADPEMAARKIAWGKFINAGQTCVAPDYVYLHRDIKQAFIKNLKNAIKIFYGDNPQKSPDYPRIINLKNLERLSGLLEKGEIITGGIIDRDDLYISPTVIENINWNDPVMQDEIFGPILPVLEYEDLDEVITAVNAFNKPLAFYVFTKNASVKNQLLQNLPFGGGCVNNVILHLSNPHLPFGGVGASGMGAYHGKKSFDTFCHYKSVLKSPASIDLQSILYPPYKKHSNIIKKALHWWENF